MNELTVALGAGPDDGVTGRVLVGTVTVSLGNDASGELRMLISDKTAVTAIGVNGDVLGPAGSLDFKASTVGALPGDVDFDGDVDIFDYNIVVTNFGRRI